MSDNNLDPPELTVRWWMGGDQITQVLAAATQWWALLASWARWPLEQRDPTTCCLPMLNLLAWEREIVRFVGEPEWLYRKRVEHALINAIDAGSTIGFVRILERLGVGYVELEERQPDRDWDVITLRLTDSQLSENPELLRTILQMYGRTCRRYEFEILTAFELGVIACEFNNVFEYDHFSL